MVWQARLAVTEDLKQKYNTLGPLLGKVEESVAGTNTGRSPLLKEYYSHWERAIFGARLLRARARPLRARACPFSSSWPTIPYSVCAVL